MIKLLAILIPLLLVPLVNAQPNNFTVSGLIVLNCANGKNLTSANIDAGQTCPSAPSPTPPIPAAVQPQNSFTPITPSLTLPGLTGSGINMTALTAQTNNFTNQELIKFNNQATSLKANITSAIFTPGSGTVDNLIYSIDYMKGEIQQLGAGYSILHSVEDMLINKIKVSGPSAFSPTEQAHITSWVNDVMSARQNDLTSKVLPGFQG